MELLVSISCLSDVLDALANHNNDRCNPDLSLPVTFRFTPRRHVRDSSNNQNCLHAHCDLCHRSVKDSESGNRSLSRVSRLPVLSTNNDTSVIHKSSDGLKVSVHTSDGTCRCASEEHPMSRLADKPHELNFEDRPGGGEMSSFESLEAAV